MRGTKAKLILGKLKLIPNLYLTAEKLAAYGLRITGDVDLPKNFLNNSGKKLLSEWIYLANEISTHPPILYLTVSPPDAFLELAEFIKNVDERVIIGVHGYHHNHYSLTPKEEAVKDIIICRAYSEWFRFPYLDTNLKLTRTVSKYFTYDSSITSKYLQPFKIGNMWEFPVTPPIDTYFRDRGLNDNVIHKYLKIFSRREKFTTFLFHPNNFTVDLMKALRKYV